MLEGIRHVHIVGIGGIGISAAAKLLSKRGISVSGSDLAKSAVTDELEAAGIKFFSGHFAEQVPDAAELVIYSNAVPETNVERAKAAERGIPQMSYPQFLGALSKAYKTIAISGTNGKSTTTAMIGLILEAAGFDPTVIVGSRVPAFPQGNLRVGQSEWLVVEACEHQAAMLNIEPDYLVLTNIEEDHLDYYGDLDHIIDAFQKYVGQVKTDVIWNADDPGVGRLGLSRGLAFGTGREAEVAARNRRVERGSQTFELVRTGQGGDVELGEITLQIPGAFNQMNALAASALALHLGIPFETIRSALQKYAGIWRRFERVGISRGADVISDYGHIPTAVSGTIAAAREFFPARRIVLCFQPHQHDRTEQLFDGFVASLAEADVLVVAEIYRVAGRTPKQEVSSLDLVKAINKAHPGKDARFAPDLDAAESILYDLIKPGDVLVIQGAGDIDEVARRLVG